MVDNVAHERIRWLNEIVTRGTDKSFVSDEPGSEGDVSASYLSRHGINIIPWDIETISLNSVTAVPFNPLPCSVLQSHSPRTNILFPNYIPPEERSETEDDDWWSAEKCSVETAFFFYQWARAGRTFPRRHCSFMSFCGVHTVTFPNPFLRCCPRSGWCPPSGGHWDIRFFLEYDMQNTPPLPHIAVTASQPVNARNNSILYGELAVILSVMNARVSQPKVGSEEEMEEVFDMQKEELEQAAQNSPAFPNEQKFPVLLFSFVGPQHARIICASMNQTQLIIRMSKLYSFEREEGAPLLLFGSWLFSRPVVEN